MTIRTQVNMPTYPQVGRRAYEVSPGGLMMGGNATCGAYALGGLDISTRYGHPSLTGVLNPGPQEMVDEAALVYELAIDISMEIFEGTGKGVVVVLRGEPTPDSEEMIWGYSHGYMGYGMGPPEPLGQPVVVAAHSPVFGGQVDEIEPSISPRLQERLSQFENGGPIHEIVREPVMAEVTGFISRLCAESDAVSATFASDGTLSVAVDFPDEKRLYAEIERDGSVEAVVIRERRYASDTLEDTVATLTSEVILAALNSV